MMSFTLTKQIEKMALKDKMSWHKNYRSPLQNPISSRNLHTSSENGELATKPYQEKIRREAMSRLQPKCANYSRKGVLQRAHRKESSQKSAKRIAALFVSLVLMLSISLPVAQAKIKVPRTVIPSEKTIKKTQTTAGEASPVSEETEVIQDNFNASQTVRISSYKLGYVGQIIPMWSGSATIISEDGHLLTNYHVVEGSDEPLDAFEICITYDLNKTPDCGFSASFIEKNETFDLALLQIDTEDFRGLNRPKFNFLTYKNEGKKETGESLTVVGYPETGLESITTTKGQVSGFYDQLGTQYIKTDALIDSGNSGGTALDSAGNFIGVPSFVLSEYDTLGYILELGQAVGWIDENITKEPVKNDAAKEVLKKEKNLILDATSEGKYTRSEYPTFEISTSGDWQFQRITQNDVQIANIIENKLAQMSIDVTILPFKSNKAVLERIFKIIDMLKGFATKYERTETTFNGLKAHLIYFSFFDKEMYNYVIPYGYAIITLSYSYDLENKEAWKDAHSDVLKSFKILDEEDDTPDITDTFTLKNPAFSIGKTAGWYFIPHGESAYSADALLEWIREDDLDAEMEMWYQKWTESEKALSNKELFEKLVDNYRNSSDITIITKNEKIMLDGLEGWSITISQPGEGVQTEKMTKVFLRDGDYYFYFAYRDADTNYDERIQDFRDILFSFQNLKNETRGEYDLGTFTPLFKDVGYHRFEKAINRLTEKGYLKLFEGEMFKPEEKITRAQTLATIIEAKMKHDEEKKNLGKRDEEVRGELESFEEVTNEEVNFNDIKGKTWYGKYVRYAKSKGYISGYKDQKFRPVAKVTLPELFSILFRVFEIPIWDGGDKVSWEKPLLDKAYEMDIVPTGIFSSGGKISRGEFAEILNRLLSAIDDNF